MNDNEQNQNREDVQDNDKPNHKPYWKRIHHSWIFWIFLSLMLVAILYYVMSVDFSLAPQIQLKQP